MRMSSWSGGGKQRKQTKGWRAKGNDPGDLSHSWQAKAPSNVKSPRSSRRRWQSHWMVYSALGAALLGLFLYVLLIRPAKTPVLMAVGIDYASPVPPNLWAHEDFEALGAFGETLAVSKIVGPFAGSGDSEGWRSFQ